MADRFLDRAFNATAAAVTRAQEEQDPERKRHKVQVDEEKELRELGTGMTAGDAIRRILLADKDKDYFRLLELPPPTVDALGRPAWHVTPAEVSKAYRKLSILVHPDKNPGEEARLAFEALNKAHRTLKDAGQLEGVLKDALEKARERKERAEAGATLDERVALNAAAKEEAARLRRAEGESFQAEIMRQMRERQEAAKRKREAQARSRYRKEEDGGEEGGSDGEAGGQQQRAKGGGAQQAAAGSGDEEEAAAAARRRAALAKQRQRRRPMGV